VSPADEWRRLRRGHWIEWLCYGTSAHTARPLWSFMEWSPEDGAAAGW